MPGPGGRSLSTDFCYWQALVGRAGRSKNGCIHLKLILCCFWAIISPHIKFPPNWTENTKVENLHYWSLLIGRAGRSENVCSLLKLILCCFWAIISPHTKFHPNRTENTVVVKTRFFMRFFSFSLKKQIFQVHFPTEFFFKI